MKRWKPTVVENNGKNIQNILDFVKNNIKFTSFKDFIFSTAPGMGFKSLYEQLISGRNLQITPSKSIHILIDIFYTPYLKELIHANTLQPVVAYFPHADSP